MSSCAFEFPFAVYTAKFGYAWSNVPAGMTPEDMSVCYKRACASKPAFLEDGQTVSGTFAYKGHTVAFLIQVAKGWDANGRDAEYGAFAFIPFDKVAAVNLTALLAQREFREPDIAPPKTIVPGALCRVPEAGKSVPEAEVGEPRAASGGADSSDSSDTRHTAQSALTVLLWIGAAILVTLALVSALKD